MEGVELSRDNVNLTGLEIGKVCNRGRMAVRVLICMPFTFPLEQTLALPAT